MADHELVTEAFRTLPKRWQSVLWRVEVEGQSAAEVARDLGLTPTAASVLTSGTPLAAPALVDGGATNTTVPATSGVVNRDARWTYSYLNTVTPAAGSYGGVNVNPGRVTYTAVTP